jgi:predicted enzyme related to lactoylglutathione lyase
VTRDAERVKRFYAEQIGWSYEGNPLPGGGTYRTATMNGARVAGIYEVSGPEFASMPDNWMPYLSVDDVDARVKKAVAAGAKLMKPVFEIPNVGRVAILMLPGGAAMGWITPAA